MLSNHSASAHSFDAPTKRLVRSKAVYAVLLLAAASNGCSGELGNTDQSWPTDSTSPSATGPSAVWTGPSSGETSPTPVGPGQTSPSSNPTGPSQTGPNPVDPTPSTSTPGSVEFAPAPGAYRRLTNAAFANSLQDLLEGPVEVGALEPDSWAVGGLPTVGAAEVSISELGVEQYQTAIEQSVDAAFKDSTRREKITGCAPQTTSDTACFQSFVTSFGRRAFRQPLTEAQVTRYVNLVGDVATTLDDAWAGMRAATTAFLMSPNFLYRMERGAAVSDSEHWRYTSHETATRLAYFLTNSTPDSTLLDLADQDALGTAEAVREQAERLLSSAAGRESVGNFARELFQLRLVTLRAKDPGMYPEYGPSLQQAMMLEVPAMFASVVFDQNASALDLFTTRSTFVTKELGALYGIEVNGQDDALVPATLPAERAGLLGTGAILSIYGSQKEGSPTLRGKFVREVLLCQHMPAPPPDVSTVLEDPPEGQTFTKRERLIQHQEQPACAGCHALMDPIGLTLESYDAIGRFRTTDQGNPIDISGSLDGTAFSGGVELGQLLSDKSETAKCMLRNIYRYGTGHVETPTEAPLLATLNERFTAGGYKLRDLMLDIVTSDGFRYVAPPTP